MRYIYSFLFIIFFLSCSTSESIEGEIRIRLKNNSNITFENATFNEVNFGNLKPNETSDYKAFETSYSYGSVNITIEGQQYGWMPIDFVGETPLESGNYTFEYNFNETTKVLTDKLVKD
ncbi:hypothetical protein [Tenacibaculum agarivorans]|uniref:hypothetical protein n=1 Tax=Tenacibaculum agarivorans TaxID=1908389 RepID=UPI000ADF67B4|nr:hypothetical protein [Tenacibaculum agarivorans]